MNHTVASEETEPISYKIEYWALGRLNSLIEKYNRKSAKLNVKPLTFTVETIVSRRLKPEFQTMWLGPGSVSDEMLEEYTYLEVSFEGDPAKINGWEFLGTIQHAETGNILRSVPGKEIPESFRTVKAHCEHCSKVRSRTDTFVLLNQNIYKQIGRNCLRDFLGHDPDMALRLLDVIREMGQEEDDRSRNKRMVQPIELLEMAAAVAIKVGFSKESAHWAWNYLFQDKILREQIKKGQMPDIRVDDEARSLCDRALSWIETAQINGFISNIKAAIGMKYITRRESTLSAWLVGAYLKAEEQDKLAQTRAQIRRERILKEKELLAGSKPVGSPGERIEKQATLLQTRKLGIGVDGQTLLLHKLLTAEGEVITWFTGTDLKLEEGKSAKVRFTVKRHQEYNGISETHVSRMRVIEEAEVKVG